MAEISPKSERYEVVPDEPAPRPRLTATESAPPRKTEPEWPVVIVRSEIPPLIIVPGREQWESDVGLHWQEFTSDDIMIDSRGRVFAVCSIHDGLTWAGTPTRSIRVNPLAKTVSTEDFRSFLKAHLEWSGCDVEEVLVDVHSGELPIGSLITRLAQTVSVEIPETESEYGEAHAARETTGSTNDYEPPQFTIRTVLVILTVVAIGCSAIASNYFGFGSFKTLFMALFTCATFALFLWIVMGAHTQPHSTSHPGAKANPNDAAKEDRSKTSRRKF